MQAKEWMLKNKEILIIVSVSVFFLILIVIGISMRSEHSEPVVKDVVQVTIPEPVKKSIDPSTMSDNNDEVKPTKGKIKEFYTEISPAEILHRIQEYGEVEALPPDYKVSHLPVGWVVYFFSLGEPNENIATISFDTSETGFGSSIISDIDLSIYPQFLDMSLGHKVWLAGTIEGVRPDGTGTFYIQTEYIDFDGKAPVQQIPEDE